MDIKQELREFFGNQVLFYIKFIREKQWGEDILDGNLFMNKIDYYRNLELQSGIKGQGDINELKVNVVPLELKLIHNETNISIPIDASKLEFELNEDKNKPVFCITGFTVDDMVVESYTNNLVKLKLPYKRENIELIKREFGEYAVILKPNEFESNIMATLEETDTDWILGKVKYVHRNSFEKLKSFSTKSPERFLYKDLQFEYQKEYRLILDENIDNNKVLSIGALSKNIGVKTIDELLDIEINLKFR